MLRAIARHHSSCGADNWNNLEPALFGSVLDELESWGVVLKAEVEVIHKLRAFDAVARGRDAAEGGPPEEIARRSGPRGPSL